MAGLDRRGGRDARDEGADRNTSCDPQGWTHLLDYLDQVGEAWKWGYCDAGLRRRLGVLCPRVATGGAGPAEVDELLMAWQVLRGFQPEYPLPITA